MGVDASPCTVSGEGDGPRRDVDEALPATVLPARFPGEMTSWRFVVAPVDLTEKSLSSRVPI